LNLIAFAFWALHIVLLIYAPATRTIVFIAL